MAGRLYLLDTNTVSHLVRQPQGLVAARSAKVGEDDVAHEHHRGVRAALWSREAGLAPTHAPGRGGAQRMTILPLESGADRHYAPIRTALEKRGTPIGANDMLIAAQARAIGAVCVTANVAEFKRVPALRVENWLE